jgi:hypothetical protein
MKGHALLESQTICFIGGVWQGQRIYSPLLNRSARCYQTKKYLDLDAGIERNITRQSAENIFIVLRQLRKKRLKGRDVV